MVLVDSIVNTCIELYKKLPKTGKPSAKEWTVISAIVCVFNDSDIKVLSMGTGSKCIGQSSMSPRGDILNDSHAEVIARRAFLKYLYLEIIQFNLTNSSQILYVEPNEIRFSIKDSVKFYFVTSMSPCGDASIMPMSDLHNEDQDSNKLLLADQNSRRKRKISGDIIDSKRLKTDNPEQKVLDGKEISDPCNEKDIKEDIHRTGAKCLPHSSIQDPHLPGIQYHRTGAVRTKPGRGDPTVSLSCSDKIAKWNSVGWQGALLSLFFKTSVFMEGIICGGGCPFSHESFNRAVNERINRDIFIPIYQSGITFPDIKIKGENPNPSSIIWCSADDKGSEVSINGRKQGVTKKNLNKKSARTSICKKELFILFHKAVNTLPTKEKFIQQICGGTDESLEEITYKELKSRSREYQMKWEVVKEKCFKVWSNKPGNLLNFTLDEDE